MNDLLSSFGMECIASGLESKEEGPGTFGPPLYSIALKSFTRMESIRMPQINNEERSNITLEVDHDAARSALATTIDLSVFTAIDYEAVLARFKTVVKEYHVDMDDNEATHILAITRRLAAADLGSKEEQDEKRAETKKELQRKMKHNVVQPKWMILSETDTCM
jgi:hypothetical protein